MSKILLTHGPTMEDMEVMKQLLENGSGELTLHLRFWVSMDGQTVCHPYGGTKRTPRLLVRLTKIAGTPRLTQQHLPITVEVLEDFEGGELLFDGRDVGKAGTVLELQYSFVDHVGSIEGAKTAAP